MAFFKIFLGTILTVLSIQNRTTKWLGPMIVWQHIIYSTAQRKGKRIPREIRARTADRMLIIRGSIMVNLRVTTASSRQIRGCMYRRSARVSYCIRASQYSTSGLHVGYTRVCTVHCMCVWARQLLLYCSTIVSTSTVFTYQYFICTVA